jgi:uncharacterized membrane protein
VSGDRTAERVLSRLMLGLFWAAFACLAAGLALWLSHTADARALILLTAGLMGLLAMPLLKLVAIMVSAAAARDRLTLGATIAVMVILGALTLRDALGR